MQLGWVDYSEQDRLRTMAVLASLQEPTAVDEIGIGIVRDAFANLFFPATSTLLTRAKYFLLVPYALRDLERQDNSKTSASALQKGYNDTEKKLAIELIKKADIVQGITGWRSLRSDFSGSWVKRGPGVLYWAHIRKLGILKDPKMSYSGYFKYAYLCTGNKKGRAKQEDIDAGWNDDDAARQSVWHIPSSAYDGWHNGLTIELTHEEARFLCNQILISCPESLFALLLRDSSFRSKALKLYAPAGEDSSAAEEETLAANGFHSFMKENLQQLPLDLQTLVTHALHFSDFIYGLRIRYNALLVGHEDEANQEWESYAPQAKAYAEALDINTIYRLLDLEQHAGAGPLYVFLNKARLCMAAGDIASLDTYIEQREKALKHGRRKIGRKEGVPESWRSGRRLSYRFGIALNLVGEIDGAGGCDA